MRGLIPIIKVNYGLSDVLKAVFIPSNSLKHLCRLEKIIKAYFGVNEVLLTSSGRSALYHILCSLQQKKVVVPAYTCDVVIEAAMLAGKQIIYAPVDKHTLNMESLDAIDDNTIVIATHQYGLSCNIKEFARQCDEKKSVLIEDCAGALGVKVDGQPVGTFGDYAFFSMNASKLITAPAMGGFAIAKDGEKLKAVKDQICLKKCDFKYKSKQLLKSTALCLDKNRWIHYLVAKIQRRKGQSSSFIDANKYNPIRTVIDSYYYGFYNWQALVVCEQFDRLEELIAKREKLLFAYLSCGIGNNNYKYSAAGNRFPNYDEKRDIFVSWCRNHGIDIGTGFSHFICPKEYTNERSIGDHIWYAPYSSGYSTKEIKQIIGVFKGFIGK